jgi:hypothetical protein
MQETLYLLLKVLQILMRMRIWLFTLIGSGIIPDISPQSNANLQPTDPPSLYFEPSRHSVEPPQLFNFNFDAHLYSAFDFDEDPDPAVHFDVETDPTA